MKAAAAEPTVGTAPFFSYELRRESRVVARLSAVPEDGGVTVATEVYPSTQLPDSDPLRRPFTFATIDQARRFADEAVLAFEYLDCQVAG